MILELIATSSWGRVIRSGLTLFLCVLLMPGEFVLYSRPQAGASPEQEGPKIPNDQLDSLVAPIALYPDPLLSQVLVASTYPLEIVQLQQWLAKNKNLKDKALTDALMKQDWDPSIQSMAVLPEAVKQLADNIKWTTDLGNAFLAQQADVMDAVQRMRMKAKDAGNLKTTEQQKVEVQTVESKTVVVIQQANPQVVYVPSYNPVVVYGPPIYPYPPIYYPPYSAGALVAASAISFGVGIAIGAAWGGGGWGYGCGWGHNDVNVNINNNFNRNTNVNRNNTNNVNRGGSNSWQHNPQHRGGAPYSNKATANKYGGSARGDSMSSRQATARQNTGQNRGSGGASSTAANRGSGGASSTAANRGSGSPSTTGANRGSGSPSNMSANRGSSGGGADRIGSQQIPKSSGSRSSSAFGGSSNGASARASSSRGASSMGSSGGRSGGGGGSRGGGGGRRR